MCVCIRYSRLIVAIGTRNLASRKVKYKWLDPYKNQSLGEQAPKLIEKKVLQPFCPRLYVAQ